MRILSLIHIFKENHFDVVYYNTCDIVSMDMLKFAKKAEVPVRIIHSHNTENQMQKKIKNIFWICLTEAVPVQATIRWEMVLR